MKNLTAIEKKGKMESRDMEIHLTAIEKKGK